ncbi:MAG: radical SAM protein [Desulfobacterales bacterium]
MKRTGGDPFLSRFPAPGLRETLKEALLGLRRPLACVQVEVTSRCPGRCRYCPHTVLRDTWRGGDLDCETFGRLWPLLRRSLRVHLQGWGEPLLHPEFFTLAALARRAGCQVSTTTCGLHLDEKLARRIVASGIDIVAFSLAGSDAATHEAARCGVGFERVLAAVETLQAERRKRQAVHLEIHFAYLLLYSALDSVAGLPALMERLGVHAAVVSTLDFLPDASLAAEAIRPGEQEKIARAAEVLSRAAAAARARGLAFDYALPAVEIRAPCRERVDRSLFVAADGTVSPCVYRNIPAGALEGRRLVFGQIPEEDPVAIWEKESFRRFRERLAAGEPDAVCRCCPKRFGTAGGGG